MATNKSVKQKSDNQPKFDSALSWLPKKTFELEITIPKETVQKTYDHLLDHAVEDTTIKGFRKGKAPRNLVEKEIGKAKLYEEVVQHVVSAAYYEAIQKHNLRPIVNPVVTPLSMKEDEDWKVKATSCEVPEVKLGKYQEAIRGLKAKKSLWTPDKGESKEKVQEAEQYQPTLDEIFDELLKNAEVEICDMLLDSETQRLIAQFVDQVTAAGITVTQYLESKAKTQEQLKAEYRESAEKTLKLEFILAEIARSNKIEATAKEVEDLITTTQDPYAKKQLQSDEQKSYLALLIRKQKTIDYLKSL